MDLKTLLTAVILIEIVTWIMAFLYIIVLKEVF